MRCRSNGTPSATRRCRARRSPSSSRKASTAEKAFVGNKNGDVKAAIAGAAKKVEAVYSYPYQNHAPMEPMNATALYTPDKCEVWCGTQDGEGAFAAAVADLGPAGRQGRRAQGHARRRLRPARPQRLRDPGGADRHADAGHADQAAVDPRRGHAARLLPSDHAVQDGRHVRQGQQPDRTAHAHLRPVDPGDACCRRAWIKDGKDPVTFQGLDPRRRDAVRLRSAEPADRPRHAQPARSGGLLARRQRQPQRDLRRKLHG